MAIFIPHLIKTLGRCISALETDGSRADVKRHWANIACDIKLPCNDLYVTCYFNNFILYRMIQYLSYIYHDIQNHSVSHYTMQY